MDARGFLDQFRTDPAFAGSLVHVEDLPERRPEIEAFPELPDLVVQRLRLLGIEGLYPHQRAAYDAVSSGSNVVKSLNLPLISGPLGTPACTGKNCATANGYITIGALRAAAKASLASNPNTTQAGPIRTYQESLKILLDQVNNNGNPPAPSAYNCPLISVISPRTDPCPFTSPY